VKLKATDENQFTATLIYAGQHGEQTEVKSMFEGSGVEE